MQKIMLTLLVTSLLAGCSTLGVYKVDIPQGTPLTQAQASKSPSRYEPSTGPLFAGQSNRFRSNESITLGLHLQLYPRNLC